MKASMSDFMAVSGEALGDRKVVRFGTAASEVRLAVADGDRRRPVGFTCYAVGAGADIAVQRTDILDGFSGLVAGTTYYLSQTTPGEITITRPTSGEVQVVGVAMTSTDMNVGFFGEEGTFNEIIMRDQVTGGLVKLSVADGVLVITPV